MSNPNAIVVKLVVSCVKLLAGFVTILDECLEDLPQNTNNHTPMTQPIIKLFQKGGNIRGGKTSNRGGNVLVSPPLKKKPCIPPMHYYTSQVVYFVTL